MKTAQILMSSRGTAEAHFYDGGKWKCAEGFKSTREAEKYCQGLFDAGEIDSSTVFDRWGKEVSSVFRATYRRVEADGL